MRAIHKGKEVVFYAPKIISNAGAIATFRKMVPEPYCTKERSATKRVKPGISAIIAFVGLKDDPRKHGFDDANYWVYSRLDHDIQARVRDGSPTASMECSFRLVPCEIRISRTTPLKSFPLATQTLGASLRQQSGCSVERNMKREKKLF